LPATPDEKRIRDGRIEGLADILLQKFEARLVAKVGQIDESSGEKVIGHDDGVAFSRRASHRWEPTKPAPPVTRVRTVAI